MDSSRAARIIVGQRTVKSVLEHRAAVDARKTFLVFEDDEGKRSSWTYERFNQIVNQVANGLLQLGVAKNDRVHLHMTNRPEFLFFWFGTSKIGAIMVPTNPLSPPNELMYPISHSGAIITVTIPDLLDNVNAARDQCPSVRQVIVCGRPPKVQPGVIEFDAFINGQSDNSPDLQLDPSDDAAILYTSGTTSRPKGVQVTHANYVFLGEQVSKNVGLRPDDRWLISLPLFHANPQYYSTMTALTVGASIAVMSRFSASRLMRQAAEHRCTIHSSLATPMRMLLAQKPSQTDAKSGLRLVIFAQSMTVEQYDEWERRYGVPLMQLFGMTETMGQPLINPLYYRRDHSSIGLPALGYECRVIDDSGNDVRPGEPGQLIIKGVPGVTIMKGYFRDSENTVKTLKGDWLWTGDIVTVGQDGYYRFLDRAKDLIRRSGENISAGEVETVIKSHPAVSDAAVVGMPDEMYDEAVKAFVVLSGTVPVTENEIVAFCRARLSKFKVPESVEFRNEFPRTSLGKIRKVELKDELLSTLNNGRSSVDAP